MPMGCPSQYVLRKKLERFDGPRPIHVFQLQVLPQHEPSYFKEGRCASR